MKSILHITSYACLLVFLSCDIFTSEEKKQLDSMNKELVKLNNSFKNEKIVLSPEILDDVLNTKSNTRFSILTYYDANCSVCFTQLEKWKDLVTYFEGIDKNLNIKFILYSEDSDMTDINLNNTNFPKSLVVYDKKNTFLRQYKHLIEKPYNTMLLNEKNEIIFIGSPLISNNIKRYYTNLITN